jgi:VanZ family protein
MLPLQHARRWQMASTFLLLAVLSATLLPVVWFWSDKFEVLSWFESIDKWLHGITFLVLSIWFAGQYRPSSYWRIAVGLLAFGLLIEICQRMVSYRTAEWFDVAADAAGIILGLAIAIAGAGGWCLRVESWIARRSIGANID